MIVAEQKSMEEIRRMIAPYERVLIIGCGTCMTVCDAGGEREVSFLHNALKLAQAVNALRGKSGGILGFFDRTRKFLGVDQLAIDQSEETGGQAAISVGKYIGENVYVEMGKGLGKESGKVKVEVELTPNVSLESQVGEDSNGGIGINWKWDY